MNYKTKEWLLSRNFIKEENSRHGNLTCIFEDRDLIGCKNYGEIPGTLNPADGDPWDVCAFGYKRRLKRGIPYEIAHIAGELVLPNGNHKLIVFLKNKKMCQKQFVVDLISYKNTYENMKGWCRGSIGVHWF
jgi:hypothetical protein